MNKNLLILSGLPASGKSSFAKEYIKENPTYLIVSRDAFRYMFKDQGFCEPKIEKLITDIEIEVIKQSLLKGFSVIVDDTNLKLKTINKFIKRLSSYSSIISFKLFDVSADECIERDSKRERSVGVDVIRRMENDFNNLKKNFKFEDIITIVKPKNSERLILEQDRSLPKCCIYDVDGTLALKGDRSPFDESKVDLDSVNHPVADMLRKKHLEYGFYNILKKKHKIIIVSGRTDACRDLTIKWLNDNKIPFDELYMRKEGDVRKDAIIKEEIYNEHIKDKYYIEYIVDDRDQVVKLYRDLGLLCLQCYYGDF